MIAVLFEVLPAAGGADRYFDLAGHLKPELERIDGFVSVERFESLSRKGRFLSLSFWRDEQAVRAWRMHAQHRQAQSEGRSGIFDSYRIRVAAVIRDYGSSDRSQAPAERDEPRI